MYGHINIVTKRVHTDFFQILSTGRVSSNKPNLQQIPARSEIGGLMRSCFIAQEGYSMVGGDFSGCELRVIAELSQDPVWVNAFLEGKDLHSELCVLTFGIDIKDVKNYTDFKPDIKYRDVQKTVGFG
jgi:DNA polymerase-1